MEFNTVSISDGITMGTEGMRASLVSREVIADSIELVARGNLFDGARRPRRLRQDDSRRGDGAGAPRHPRRRALRRIDRARPWFEGSDVTIQDVFEAVGAHASGKHDRRRVLRRSRTRLPRRRRVRRAVHREHDGDRLRVPRHRADGQRQRAGDRSAKATSRAAGALVMDLLGPRRAAARTSSRARRFENAIAAVAATGGSTNAVLHLLAIAREAGVELDARRLRSHQRATSAARRPEAGRPVRRDRPARAPAARARRASGCSTRARCTATR